MSSKLMILVLGLSFSTLSFAQSAADIRAEITTLNQSLHSVSDFNTSSKSTKASVLSQLMKIQSEVSNLDVSNARSAVKQDLKKRISTAIHSATHVDRYSDILLDEALTGLDTDLVEVQYQYKPALDEDQPKAGKSHAKLECTPSPPNAVVCNGEYYKKDNSVVSNGNIKAISEKASNDSLMSMENEASEAGSAN